jgi:hypothetical protein
MIVAELFQSIWSGAHFDSTQNRVAHRERALLR